jgi:hypothetical protein
MRKPRIPGAVQLMATPMTMGVDEFTRYLNQDIAKWARIVKVSGAKPEQCESRPKCHLDAKLEFADLVRQSCVAGL